MTGSELLKIHKMAKDFCELYSRTGLIDVKRDNGMPAVQIRVATFFELFGDGEYEYIHHKNGEATVFAVYDGVKYLAYVLKSDNIPERSKDE